MSSGQPINTPGKPVRDYISFSSISLFQKCSLRYFFKYVANLPEDSVSASFVFGRAIHRAIEFHYNELLAGNGPPDRDTLLAEFNDGWDEQPADQIAYPKTDTRDSLADLADRVLVAFQQSEVAQPRGRVLGVEEELRGQVIDGVPDVLARLDLLVQDADGLTLTDFKTAKNAWTADQTTDSGEQLLLYSELVRQRFPGWPIRLEFIVFKKGKTVTVGRHAVPLNAARLERTKRIAQRVWRAIQAGNFFPSPSPMNCGTCPFREPCRRWSGE
jgi:RecB family exonuclease